MSSLCLRSAPREFGRRESYQCLFHGGVIPLDRLQTLRNQHRLRYSRAVQASSTPVNVSGSPKKAASTNFFKKLFAPLTNFGYGKTSIWQGGVGLFIFAGIGLCMMLITWARNGVLGGKGQGYQAIFEFPSACGITVGTPVRIRGVPVGSVLSVQPSLERVDVLAELKDVTTVIPRTSLIEANQMGLIAEPFVDITPQLPVQPYTANPLDDTCEAEGKVVCHMGRIRGEPGVSMDELVHAMQKTLRNMESKGGVEAMSDMVDNAGVLLEKAKPLMSQVLELVDEVKPLLTELRESQLVGNIEALSRVAVEVAEDIHKLQNVVLDEKNVAALRDSVVTLTRTLEHMQSIAGDIGGLTGDSKVQANLKQLVEALSRLVND